MTQARFETIVESRPSFATVSVERGGAEVVDRIADEWRELCAATIGDEPYYRPEWIRAYLRAFEPEATTVLISARVNGRLHLLLPLIEENATFSKVPVRRLRTPVNYYAGRFDAACEPGPKCESAIHATWKYLKESGSWDLLYLPYALGGSTISRLVGFAQTDGTHTIQLRDKPSPYVPIPADPELLRQMPINARLRRELRSVRRQIAAQGLSLKFSRTDTADRSLLDCFYRLEASGWKAQETRPILCRQKRPFFDEIAESAARFGYLTLYTLELNSQAIAAQYGFTHRNCYYSLIVAYDENFRRWNPGHLLVDEIVRDCAARGIGRYDITGEDQEWKTRWTKEARSVSHYFIFKGPVGTLAYAVGTKLKPALGRLFAGRKLGRKSCT